MFQLYYFLNIFCVIFLKYLTKHAIFQKTKSIKQEETAAKKKKN